VFWGKVVISFLDMKGYNQIQYPESIEIKSRIENKERKAKKENEGRISGK
jgi:hypothetical protein